MTELRDIYLYGRLGRLYGKHHRFAVRTPIEAIRAISVNFPGADKLLRSGRYRMVVGDRKKGFSVDERIGGFAFTADKAFNFIPETKAGATGFEWAFIAVAALTAATVLLRPPIEVPRAEDRADDKASFIFDGAVNSPAQGLPVPLVYGRVRTGSVVASAGISTSDVLSTSLPANVETPGGFFGNLAVRAYKASLVAKGGKGGGSQRTAQEEPNTLQSQATARIIDVISEGEIVGLVDGLKSVYFDDTPVQNADGSYNFSGLVVDERVGLPNQPYISGFPSVELTRDINLDVNNLTGPITQTITDPDTNRARVTIRLDQLTEQDTTNGDLRRTSVTVAIDLQSNGGGFTNLLINEITGKTTSPYQRSYDIELPPGGHPWNIRVRRVTPDRPQANVADDIKFDLLTEIIDAKLSYPDTALIGLTVDARQFGTNIPTRGYEVDGRIIEVPVNYDPVTRTYTGNWNGTFKRAYSNNPAWVFRDICLNERYGLGSRITDAQIDKFGLYQIAQYCDQLVSDGAGGQEPRYTINTTIASRREAYDVLQAIASNCRSMVYFQSGSIFLSQEAPKDPVKLVTLANISNEDGFEYDNESLDEYYSAFIVSFNDPTDAYRLNYEVVEDPALVQRIGWKTKTLTGFGFTTRGRARREGMWAVENQKFASDRIRYSAAFDHMDAAPGQIVSVADPMNTVTRRGGKIRAATTTTVTFDKPVVLAPGETHFLDVILPNGKPERRTISTGAGTQASVTVSTPFTAAPIPGSVWVLASSNVVPRQWEVRSIRERGNGDYEVAAVSYDPNKFARVENNVRIDPAPWSDIPSGALPPPRGIQYREFLKPVGTSQVPYLLVSVTPALDPRIIAYQFQVKRPGSIDFEPAGESIGVSVEIDNATQGEYGFRARSVDAIGKKSPWIEEKAIIGGTGNTNNPTAPLPSMSNLRILRNNTTLRSYLTWDQVSDQRRLTYEVFYSPSLSVDSTFDLAQRVGATEDNVFDLIDLGRYWVRIKFLDQVSAPVSIDATAANAAPQVDYNVVIGRPRNLADLDPTAQVNFDAAAALTNQLAAGATEQNSRILTLENEVTQARGGGASIAARLSTIETAQAGADTGPIAARVTTLEAEVIGARNGESNLLARLSTIDTARVNGDTALGTRATTLEAQMANTAGSGLQSRIATEETTRANADSTLASRASTLESNLVVPEASLNQNPNFGGLWTSGQLPESWQNWFSGTSNTRTAGQASLSAIRFATTSGQNQGIAQFGFFGSIPNYVRGYYVLEADVTLNSGTLSGSGVAVDTLNAATGGTFVEGFQINFETDLDINGSVIGAGTAGRTYRYRKLIQFTNTTGVEMRLFAMASWDQFNASRPAKDITFHRVAFRAATDSEIELRQARGPSATVGARILAEETTRANADSALATRATTLESQMGDTAASGLRSRIIAEETTRANADTALANRATTLEAQMANTSGSGLQSRIASEETARANADTTLASRATVVESIVTTASASLNRNPNFTGTWSGGQIPTNWSDWISGANNTQVLGRVSDKAVRFATVAGASQGLLQASPTNLVDYSPGWYVIEAEITLNSGNLSGSGVLVRVLNVSTVQQDNTLNFGFDFDINNVQNGSGTAGRTYMYRRLVQFTPTVFTSFQIYAMASWDGFDTNRPAKDITFHRIALRPASESEIETRQARGGSSSLSARITTAENTTATVDGKLNASYALTVDAGGRIAQMKLLSNGTTSTVAFTASSFQVFNNTTNEAPFEVVGGVVNIKEANIRTVNASKITTGTISAATVTVGSAAKILIDGTNNRIVISD